MTFWIIFLLPFGMKLQINPRKDHPMGPDGSADPKIREARLRRIASRRGMVLAKSRRRDPKAADYGTFVLIGAENTLSERTAIDFAFAAGENRTLDEIEQQLESD